MDIGKMFAPALDTAGHVTGLMASADPDRCSRLDADIMELLKSSDVIFGDALWVVSTILAAIIINRAPIKDHRWLADKIVPALIHLGLDRCEGEWPGTT